MHHPAPYLLRTVKPRSNRWKRTSIRGRVRAALHVAGHNGMTLQELVAAMPDVHTSSVGSALSAMTHQGEVQRAGDRWMRQDDARPTM